MIASVRPTQHGSSRYTRPPCSHHHSGVQLSSAPFRFRSHFAFAFCLPGCFARAVGANETLCVSSCLSPWARAGEVRVSGAGKFSAPSPAARALGETGREEGEGLSPSVGRAKDTSHSHPIPCSRRAVACAPRYLSVWRGVVRCCDQWAAPGRASRPGGRRSLAACTHFSSSPPLSSRTPHSITELTHIGRLRV